MREREREKERERVRERDGERMRGCTEKTSEKGGRNSKRMEGQGDMSDSLPAPKSLAFA